MNLKDIPNIRLLVVIPSIFGSFNIKNIKTNQIKLRLFVYLKIYFRFPVGCETLAGFNLLIGVCVILVCYFIFAWKSREF